MDVLIYNKGCIREHITTQKLREEIVKQGHSKSYKVSEADVLVYITCAGLGDVLKECINEIDSFAYYKKKDATLIITGCMAKIKGLFSIYENREDVKIIETPDFVIPILNYINGEEKRNTMQRKLENRTRKYYDNDTQIQFFLTNGCLNHCSFCKVNYLDEPLTSLPYATALKYMQDKIKNGTKSIIVSGQNLTLYGIDLYNKPMLHQFIHDLSQTPGLVYLTVNELTAQNMYPALLKELLTNDKVVNVGIQLESASDRILTLMNRQHNLEKYDAIVTALRKANKFVNTVLMSGFPTESYEDLDFTITYLRDREIATELICKYSDFELLPSSELEQLSKREKIKHTMYLKKEIAKVNYEVLMKQMDKTANAIVYGKKENTIYLRNFFSGYSIRKEHQDLAIGDKISTPAKRLVHQKESPIRYQYKY